jgi:cytochrome b pre-mRNA-processing protein 3
MLQFARRRRGERAAADRIYAACLAASRRPALYLSFGVPDTLEGRFEMIALALFPVLNRLLNDPGDDPQLARLVSESFVNDMDSAFREMGVSDTAVPKRMQTLYRSFAGRAAAYGEALRSSEDTLAEALARNIFPDVENPEGARSLAKYLKESVAAVRNAELSSLRGGEVPFPPLERERA